MHNKPIIGITGAYVKHNSYMEGVYVHQDYHKSVILCGGIPIILPYVSPEITIEMLKLCDGIILSGGEDVDPKFYGQDPRIGLGHTIPERDQVEISIVNYALKHQVPLLAICRGVQLLNVALGGTLIQDIPSTVSKALQHSQTAERNRDTHWVTVEKNSKLYEIFQEDRVRVNSLHHQAIDVLAPDLRAVAKASDGIIEAVEYTKVSSFFIAVQWHPESLASTNPLMRRLISQFIASTQKI
ncbi:putative glutamine amidotransferasec [Desulfosporosinus acididurans]|uniref:Putative glutamine amidotransferasec n=1 Tax=Desulfosporosinus acididurans TaxID=476652 RepID=A0A0J1FL73_9FIRM|nr:gamma-glutamyl-gamma-aminobutyrate hydrolase family protein [Desulfosporosinus acididurans]KLU63678.1 putative glutamine amidotransferasec [Desulfosporosinus acididurans]